MCTPPAATRHSMGISMNNEAVALCEQLQEDVSLERLQNVLLVVELGNIPGSLAVHVTERTAKEATDRG